uniref:Uncharacterized protein AlNc14C250G9632 n=1 Tax=Albugo laibachii Nc14 TaxID=890382 RepID=F0WTF3_9STRA|nr:cleavage induced conserved hypothetical protein [Albugo laibachii Nc14]|eukprot:CCA24643.1 cleavage induced conserved hypothetical protein [Albugo laibachii Nc14]
MFSIVEKTYRVELSEEKEASLQRLGQSRIETLINQQPLTLIEETKKHYKLYEFCENDCYTMKASTTTGVSLIDIMSFLRMEDTAVMRDVMGELFGSLFLDAMVLHQSKGSFLSGYESMSVNWMALQSCKPHLQHRDYTFLRFGDIIEKQLKVNGVIRTKRTGVSIWESVELDGCAPLPTSQNIERQRFHRCGFVVEELEHTPGVRISFSLSEPHSGRTTISELTRLWMIKMVSCITEIPTAIVSRALASQILLTKKELQKDGSKCNICHKAFSMLRRKHHCRVCGDLICSKCSDMRYLRQRRIKKDIRVCIPCWKHTSISSTCSLVRARSDGAYPVAGLSSVTDSSTDDIDVLGGRIDKLHVSACVSGSEAELSTYSTDNDPSDIEGNCDTQATSAEAPTKLRTSLRRSKTLSMASDKTSVSTSYNSFDSAIDMLVRCNSFDNGAMVEDDSTLLDSEIGMGSYENRLDYQDDISSTVSTNTPYTYKLNFSAEQKWPKAPIPHNEIERLQKLRTLCLIDPKQQLRNLCTVAATELGFEWVVICFVGDKSCFLIPQADTEANTCFDLPRNIVPGAHAIMSKEPMIVLDTSIDPRFAKNPAVLEKNIKLFAGFPLITSDGYIVGCLSVADNKSWDNMDGTYIRYLESLAEMVMLTIELYSYHYSSKTVSRNTTCSNLSLSAATRQMQQLLNAAYATQRQVRTQACSVKDKR